MVAAADFSRYWSVVAGWLGLETIFCIWLYRVDCCYSFDWLAYMQQVEVILSGNVDYADVRGVTGPIQYPGGHALFFTLFYFLTDLGRSALGKFILFLALYLGSLLILAALIRMSKSLPWYTFISLSFSRRIHSIYVLGFFSDPLCMLFLYASLYVLLGHRHFIGASFLLSVAVSLKMNALLFCPAFFLIFCWYNRNWLSWILSTAVFMGWQITVALPFVLPSHRHYEHYLAFAFNFSRTFEHSQSVTWQFISPDLFVSALFARSLLVLLGLVWLLFAWKWSTRYRHSLPQHFELDMLLDVCLVTNLLGCALARSLHYQFYAWYGLTVPMLVLFPSKVPLLLRLIAWVLLESGWNVHPPTPASSIAIGSGHLLLLVSRFYWLDSNLDKASNGNAYDYYGNGNGNCNSNGVEASERGRGGGKQRKVA
jgi:alpha-1,3-mannosyltransferase